MKLLVLGGTLFLGRHIVDAACAAGHAVTIFHRGLTKARRTDGVEVLHGDRNGDVGALEGRHFDAVIDCSGFTPAQLERTGTLLAHQVDHYLFVSSISAYRAFPPRVVFDESAPLHAGDEGYGPQKARAEEAIAAAIPGRVTIVRPGLIVGPDDPTARFTYWPRRIARGGDVLVPGRPERPVQIVDARDLAAWCVRLAGEAAGRVLHGVGPSLTMQAMQAAIARGIGAGARPAQLHWTSDAWLLAQHVEPWTELPLWLPEDDAEFGGMLLADDRRAVEAGLVCRPVEDTARDTLAWARSPDAAEPKAVATLTQEREAALLAMPR